MHGLVFFKDFHNQLRRPGQLTECPFLFRVCVFLEKSLSSPFLLAASMAVGKWLNHFGKNINGIKSTHQPTNQLVFC